jgi:hypothetical protein
LQKLFEPIVLAPKQKTKEAWTGKCSTTISSLQGGAEQNHQQRGGCSVHIKQIMPQLCEIKSQNEDP